MTTDLDIARQVCTPKELQAYQLRHRGMSERAIALALDISRGTVRSRLENSTRKINRHRRQETAA